MLCINLDTRNCLIYCWNVTKVTIWCGTKRNNIKIIIFDGPNPQYFNYSIISFMSKQNSLPIMYLLLHKGLNLLGEILAMSLTEF